MPTVAEGKPTPGRDKAIAAYKRTVSPAREPFHPFFLDAIDGAIWSSPSALLKGK